MVGDGVGIETAGAGAEMDRGWDGSQLGLGWAGAGAGTGAEMAGDADANGTYLNLLTDLACAGIEVSVLP